MERKCCKKLTPAAFSPPVFLQAIDNSTKSGFNISGEACYRNIQQLKNMNVGSYFPRGQLRELLATWNMKQKMIDFKFVKEEGKN